MKNKPEKCRKLIEFENVLHEEECDKLLYIWSTQSTLIVMYAYYHYFNADITRIDDMLAGAIIRKKTNLRVAGIYSSVLNEDSIDFLSQMDEDYFRGVFLADISEQLNQLAKKMAYVLIKTPYMDNGEEIKILESSISESKNGSVGEITSANKEGITVKCSDKSIVIKRLKPFGKKDMNSIDYINGNKNLEGERFE